MSTVNRFKRKRQTNCHKKYAKAVLSSLLLNFVASAIHADENNLAPAISFPETEFDLGQVDEGAEFHHTFKIENHGQKTLQLKTAFSTCGCTVPVIKNKEIKPGESGNLEVIMDTSMKQGRVSKPIEIHSNDPANPVSTIYIKANVRSPHADLGTDKTAKIFTGRCAACHVNKGTGKTGEDLFVADCAMCHGFRAAGIPGVAPALVPFDYHSKEIADTMKKIVSFGSKTHRSMPGYSKEAGGPLNEDEINSLIDFLKNKSDRESKSKQPQQEP